MALNARIGADFSDFNKSLQGMESQVKSSASAISSIFGVSLSLAAVTAYIGGILRLGDEIQKLADKTGMSAEETQKLGFIAKQSGLDMGAMAMAAQNLQQRLGDDDAGAVGALARLGINAAAFAKQNTYAQMQQLAGAIGSLVDPTTRAAIAADLFGKSWKETMPALVSDFKALAAAAPVMSNETVDALAAADDALDKFKTTMQVTVAEAYIGAVKLVSLAQIASTAATRQQRFGALLFGMENIDVASEAVQNPLRGVGTPNVAMSADEVAAAVKKMTAEVEKSIPINKAAAAEAEKLAAALLAISTMSSDTVEAMRKWEWEVNREVNKTLQESVREMNNATVAAAVLGQALAESIPAGARDATAALSVFAPAVRQAFTDITGVNQGGVSITEGAKELSSVLEHLPDIIGRAIASGGSLSTAFGAIGSEIGRSLGADIGKSLTKSIGGSLGKVLGDTLPVVGALVGSLLGPAFDKLFKTEGKKVNDLRDAYIGAAGGFSALAVKAQAAGMSIKALLDAKNVKDYEAAIKKLNLALSKTAELDALRASSISTWDTISALAEKYGISVEAAGQAVQQLMITSNAKVAINDWQTWAKAGGDMNVMAAGMAKSMSTLVQQAQAYGTTLPENLRPVLDFLSGAGTLVDAAGNTIDVSSLTFGPEVQTEMERVAKAIEDLVAELRVLNGLPPMSVGGGGGGSVGYGAGGGGGMARVLEAQDARMAGGRVDITVQAWDGASVQSWLDRGGSRQLANALVPELPGVVSYRVGR